MLSRAFIKARKSPRDAENSYRSVSIFEYEDFIFGYSEDLPLILCNENRHGDDRRVADDHLKGCVSEHRLTLREVLRASVGVMGESRLGMTEKMVLLEGRVCAVKRFRKVKVKRSEFGRRIESFAQVSRQCKYLVSVRAYLLTKRIKFVVCDYYPMGSLADLLAGARELGHTALGWEKRCIILLHIGRAISFIHSLYPRDKNFQLNVHGNIKSSNVMINTDFTAHLSDYGFAQVAGRVEVSNDTGQQNKPSPENPYKETLSQKGDIYNFGIIMLDILGGPKAPHLKKCIAERKEEIMNGDFGFFEFYAVGKERKQALQVLDIALACTSRSPDSRPTIEHVLSYLGNVTIN